MGALTNHLWQSTLFTVLVAGAALALKSNQANTRYWLWLVASVKFLIPFSLLVTLGSRVEVPSTAPTLPAVAVEQITTSFAPVPPILTSTPQASEPWWPPVLAAAWFIGSILLLTRWFRRWLLIHAALRGASRLPIAAPLPVLSSHTAIEPGVFGIVRPVLLLPEGITQNLSSAELDAILAHELTHVRRRDNLTAALHMLVETLFWFHPLVWWIGSKLVEERERACDEAVLREGSRPEIYAQSVLNVCKYYLESPLPCASGVTGADLKKRIEEIMTQRISYRLTWTRKLLLATAGLAAVAVPICIGVLNAQSKSEPLTFEVATIKPADPDARRAGFQLAPGGGLNIMNVGLKQLIGFAYEIPCGKGCDNQIVGGPGWLDSQRFDITAKAPPSAGVSPGPGQMTPEQMKTASAQVRERLRALLAERFQLTIRHESKEMPVYALTVGKNGHKLKESTAEEGRQMMRGGRGQLIAENATMQLLLVNLAGITGRPVLDRTGLTGRYNFTLEYAPEFGGPGPGGPGEKSEVASGSSDAGPSIFAAIQEQLGLKLEATKGPVEVIVIDRAEKPTAN